MTEKDVLQQIKILTEDIIKIGLCDDQNFPTIIKSSDKVAEICIGKNYSNSFLKNMAYSEMYDILYKRRSYNLRMADGALISMHYCFIDGEISTHRLSFFPSPNLEEFQNNPEIYLNDEIYADVSDKRIVPFPLRFDYENTSIAKAVEHPISHLTLGQYDNCRIPVNSAITPSCFLDFIIRNFYNTAFSKFCDELHHYIECFQSTIFEEEEKLIHVGLPCKQ